MASHRVCTTIRKNGERLVTVRRGFQIEALSAVYIATLLRRMSGSFNAVRSPAIAIAALLSFCQTNEISLFGRIVSGRILLDWEWRRFMSDLSRNASPATVARRAKDTLRFLRFWARWWAETIGDIDAHDKYLARAALKLQAMLEDIAPAGKAGSDRDEIPPSAIKVLVRILDDEAALARLWPTPWVRIRNTFALRLLLLLGNRAGEALGLRLADLDLDGEKPSISFIRRQDDLDDLRCRQPSLKGRNRKVAIPVGLMPDLAKWLAVRPQARPTTDYLLIAMSGEPLSASSVAKIFQRLGECYPELAGYSSHSLRHSYVATARRVRDRDGDPQADASWALAQQVGWTDKGSDASYGHAQRAAAADALMLRVQEELLAPSPPPSAKAAASSTEYPSQGPLGAGGERPRSRLNGPDRSM